MKKKSLVIAAVAAVFGLQSAHAQYPQLTDEAAAKIGEMKAQWEAHADKAWEQAFPIVVKEAKEGRPYVPWASRP
ncbi:MAG: polysaccharide lyase, partial [Prevotella sp.]|nr:polysaccharide lyase [Prevotella sp.]